MTDTKEQVARVIAENQDQSPTGIANALIDAGLVQDTDRIEQLERERDELAAALRLARTYVPKDSWINKDIDAALAKLDTSVCDPKGKSHD